jgi:asparagine synthase (glutamine-hydrolysing)
MSGDGGDELFCGYNRYLHSKRIWNSVKVVPPLLCRWISKGLSAVSPGTWDRLLSHVPGRLPRMGYKLQKLAESLESRSLEEVYRRLVSYWPEPEQLVFSSREPEAFFHPDFTLGETADFIDRMCFWDQVAYLPDDNLTKMDRASMSVGLETRAPLLDHRVVAFSWRLGNQLKVAGGKSKWILRQLLYRYVPKALIERPKMGFSVPVGEWLRGPLTEWASDLLSETLLSRQGILNPSMVQQTWQDHLTGRVEGQNRLWAVLMFQAWYQAFEG